VELVACRDRRGMIDAYDRLLSDAMHGDPLLFARQDEVEQAWRIVDPVLARLRRSRCTSRAPGARRGRPARRAVWGMVAPANRLLMSVRRLRDPEEVARRAADAPRRAPRRDRGARRVHDRARGWRHTAAYVRMPGERLVRRLDEGRVLLGRRAIGSAGRSGIELSDGRVALLDPLGIDARRIHRISAERSDLDAVALEYEAELARVAGGTPGGPPAAVDLALLGMGPDGHTASLFPHTDALSASHRWFVANEVPRLSTVRFTATFALLERARAVFFLVTGESKAAALADVLEGAWNPELWPSQRLWAFAGWNGSSMPRRERPARCGRRRDVTLESYALDQIRPGHVVGLGTGARRGALRARAGGPRRGRASRCAGIAHVARDRGPLALALGIPLVSLDDAPRIDIAVDGADEVDPDGRLIKGYGGALCARRSSPSVAERVVILVGAEKCVPQLARAAGLPVEVLPFGEAPVLRQLSHLGVPGTLRRLGDRPQLSDNGNLLVDCAVSTDALWTRARSTARSTRFPAAGDRTVPRLRRDDRDRAVGRRGSSLLLRCIHKEWPRVATASQSCLRSALRAALSDA
jgi:ribose 5-phosphate isomerase A